MQQPEIATYRVRVGWLNWLGELHWTDWYEIRGLDERYLSGVPVAVAGQTKNGIILNEDGRQVRQNFEQRGRYIPSHRVVAVDWEAR